MKKATKLEPQQYITWGDLGTTLYYSGKKDEAAAPTRKAVELASQDLKTNPHDPVVLSALAGYYSVLNDRQHALGYLGQACSTGTTIKKYCWMLRVSTTS